MIKQISLWYTGLSMRERILIGVAAVLAAIVTMIFGIAIPLSAAVEERKSAYQASVARLARIEAQVRAKPEAAANRPAPADTAPLDLLITQSATEIGFKLDKSEARGPKRLVIEIAQARPVPLMTWLNGLSDQGITVEEMTSTAAANGTLSSRITLIRQGQ